MKMSAIVASFPASITYGSIGEKGPISNINNGIPQSALINAAYMQSGT
jgi:hypothetical protein